MEEKPTNLFYKYLGRSLARPNKNNTLNTRKCAKYGFWHAYVVKWDILGKHFADVAASPASGGGSLSQPHQVVLYPGEDSSTFVL